MRHRLCIKHLKRGSYPSKEEEDDADFDELSDMVARLDTTQSLEVWYPTTENVLQRLRVKGYKVDTSGKYPVIRK